MMSSGHWSLQSADDENEPLISNQSLSGTEILNSVVACAWYLPPLPLDGALDRATAIDDGKQFAAELLAQALRCRTLRSPDARCASGRTGGIGGSASRVSTNVPPRPW